MLRRRALMFNQSRLPAEYTELKYIQGNGNQYTKLNDMSNSTVNGMEVDCSIDENLRTYNLHGLCSGFYGRKQLSVGVKGNSYYYGYNGKEDTIAGAYVYGTRYKWFIGCGTNSQEVRCIIKNLDGTEVLNSLTTATKMTLPSLIAQIFFTWKVGESPCASRLYEAKFLHDAEIVATLIPALNSSGEAGLYNTLTEEFASCAVSGRHFGYEKLDGTYVAPV